MRNLLLVILLLVGSIGAGLTKGFTDINGPVSLEMTSLIWILLIIPFVCLISIPLLKRAEKKYWESQK